MSNVFDRRRDGVPEDRRTWALFLALRRHKPLLQRFLAEVLRVEHTATALEAEPWPTHYSGCQPDGEIRVGSEWLLVFEAKVRGNTLSAEQVEPYLEQAGALAKGGQVGLITFLHDPHPPADVVAVTEQRGMKLFPLGHQQVLGHLRSWSTESTDPVLALLAGDLADFLIGEMQAREPRRITTLQLATYQVAAGLVHEVDDQLELRCGALKAALAIDVDVRLERAHGGWIMWTADYVPRTRITAGVYVVFSGHEAALRWWLQVEESACHGADIATIAADVLNGRTPDRDDEGPWWFVDEPVPSITDPGMFERDIGRIAERFRKEMATAAVLWERLVRDAYAATISRTSLPLGYEKLLRRVVEGELKGNGTVLVTSDALRVLGRTQRPSLFEAWWSGAKVREAAKLTLWAVDLPGKVTFATGKWFDAHRKGRYSPVNSAASLQDALTVAELLRPA